MMGNNTINELKRRILNKKVSSKDKVEGAASSLKETKEFEEYRALKKGESFSDGVDKYIREKDIKASDLYTKAYVDRRVYSKMSNRDYKISKNTAICFCLAMELTLFEAQEMLKRIGYALSNYDDFDIVISYCFENKIYDIIEINGYLEDLHLPLLGQKTR